MNIRMKFEHASSMEEELLQSKKVSHFTVGIVHCESNVKSGETWRLCQWIFQQVVLIEPCGNLVNT